MDCSKQLKVFQRMFSGSRLQAVLYYFSGFTKLASPAIRDFILTYSKQKNHIKDLLPLLHCFYEAQERSLCMMVAPQFSQTIDISDELGPIDFLVIGYAVASLSSHLRNIHIKIHYPVDQQRFKLILIELAKFVVSEVPATKALPRTLRLDLHGQSLSHEKLTLLSSHLSQSSIITFLWIESSKIHGIAIERLWEALQTNSSLTELHITNQMSLGYMYYDRKAHCSLALKSMLEVNKSISHLDFSKTGLDNLAIFQGLQHNNTLVHLNLSNTERGITQADTIQALATMIQVNKTLEHLDLSNNKDFFSWLGPDGFFQNLRHNTSLIFLNLNNTGLLLTIDTVQALTNMLKDNKTLTHLDLSENIFYPGAQAHCIFQGLQRNTSLTIINFNNTRFKATYDTAQALSKLLKVNKTLKHLDLSQNELFFYYIEAHAHCIFQGLKRNTSLVVLNLSDTGFQATEENTRSLTTMLQANKTLTHLDLSNNRSFFHSRHAVDCMYEGLRHNTTLKEVKLDNTGLMNIGKTKLRQAAMKFGLTLNF